MKGKRKRGGVRGWRKWLGGGEGERAVENIQYQGQGAIEFAIRNRNCMEYLKAQEREGRQRVETSKKSVRIRQTEKFIPPTHPAYVITSSFDAPHITRLSEEMDKHFIVTGMQTGRKKLVKAADMPTDKFFIIVDDSGIPIVLEEEFLILPSKIVRYPRANSAEEVVKAFEKYIGLGHYEVNKEYEQVNDHSSKLGLGHYIEIQKGMAELPQQMLQEALKTERSNGMVALASNQGTPKIRLREVSSIKKESTLMEGVLFVYDNRKDALEFKEFVGKLKGSYEGHPKVRLINRIDEYISYFRSGKGYDNVILLSEYSYLNLSKYFQKYRGFAVFQEQNTQINLFAAKNVLFFAQDEQTIQAYARKLIEGNGDVQGTPAKALSEYSSLEKPKEYAVMAENKQAQGMEQQKDPNNPIKHLNKRKRSDDVDLVGENSKSNASWFAQAPEKSLKSAYLPKNENSNKRSQIKLVKVSDISKEDIKRIKNAAKPQGSIKIDPNRTQKGIQKASEPVKLYFEEPQVLNKKDKKGKLQVNAENLSIKPEKQKKKEVKANTRVPREVTIAEFEPQSDAQLQQKRDKSRSVYYALPKLPSIDKIIPMEKSQRSLSSIGGKKIKRLKSVKGTKNNLLQPSAKKLASKDGPQKTRLNMAAFAAGFVKEESRKDVQKNPISSILKGHLRMGSDENYSRSNEKPKFGHCRALSADKNKDHEETPYIKMCLSSPKPSEESDGQERAIPVGAAETIQSYYLPQPEQKNMARPKAPLKASSAQLSAKRVDFDSKIKKQQIVAFCPEMGAVASSRLDSVQNSFGKSANNQYRTGMLVLSEEEMEQEEKAKISIPKQTVPLKLAAEQLRKGEKQFEEDAVNAFKLGKKPYTQGKEEKNKVDPTDEADNKKRLNQRNKVNAARQNYASGKRVQSPPIPPSFEQVQCQSSVELYSTRVPKINLVAPSEQSRLKESTEGAFDICGTSDISSIPRKLEHKAAEKRGKKRFTFGEEELANKLRQKKSKQKVKLFNNLQNSIAYENIGEEAQPETRNKQAAVPIDPSHETRDFSGRIAHNTPRKSKSHSQVQRIFDRFKVKAAIQTGKQPSGSNPMESESTENKACGLGSNLTSQNSDPRVGKIYSQLQHRPSTYRIPRRERVSKPKSVDEYPTYGLRHRAGSPELASKHHKPVVVSPNIQDLIDMSRYEKVIENGITVYRSKVPVRVENYYPSTVAPAAPSALPERLPLSVKQEDPYLLCRNTNKPRDSLPSNKENLLGSDKPPTARVLARFVPKQPEHKRVEQQQCMNQLHTTKPKNDSVGIQCSADPFNSLTNVNNLQLMASISNLTKSPRQPHTSKFSTVKSPPKKLGSKSPHPIQDLLASKLSDSQKQSCTAPFMFRNLILPQSLTEEHEEGRDNSKSQQEESQQMQDGPSQKIVLYLVDKQYPKDIYSDLLRCKSPKDSVLSFKNEQQLLLQLSQTKQIFDIVYVVSISPFDFRKILSKQKNCYLVELEEGCKTKIKGDLIKVASLKYLQDVTDLILKQSSKDRKGKSRLPNKPMKFQSPASQHNSCLSPRQFPQGRACCQHSMFCSPTPVCSLHHRHC